MKQNKAIKLKVIITGIKPANRNTAAYNRFLATVKMVKASFECEVVMSERAKIKNRIFNGLIARFSFVQTLIKIFSKIDNKKYSHIIFLKYSDPFLCLFCWLLAKPKNIKLALERNEFPAPFISSEKKSIKKVFYTHCILTWHYRLFDVLFLMTDELIDFYGRYTRKNCIIQKLPMTVDFSRFKTEKPRQKAPYIFYAGSLSESKDGVESLLHAFKIISDIYPNINLKIAGVAKNENQLQRLLDIIREHKIEDRTDILGLVKRDDIPGYLCSAKIVVLPRPDSMQARGGFPTKLGEYLAAGIPVIVTRVGEIPKYLTENEVFFISPKNIINELVEKIKYILSNYSKSLDVAEKGKTVAINHFSLETNQKAFKDAFQKLFSYYRVSCEKDA